MRYLAVDDERLMLDRLVESIREADPEGEVSAFRSPQEAIDAMRSGLDFDVAFLDIKMRGMDGIQLGKELKSLRPRRPIVFCTGYSDYAYEAISKVRCVGYVLKPVTAAAIRAELDNLREVGPVTGPAGDAAGAETGAAAKADASAEAGANAEAPKPFVRCFGNFEVFKDGRPIAFRSAKSKELFAFLVDRNGAVCRNGAICAALWSDDGDHTSYLKKCRADLERSLADAGCPDAIIRQWGGMGVNRDAITCDYYEWVSGTALGVSSYNGEYMEQYSWAEERKAAVLLADSSMGK